MICVKLQGQYGYRERERRRRKWKKKNNRNRERTGGIGIGEQRIVCKNSLQPQYTYTLTCIRVGIYWIRDYNVCDSWKTFRLRITCFSPTLSLLFLSYSFRLPLFSLASFCRFHDTSLKRHHVHIPCCLLASAKQILFYFPSICFSTEYAKYKVPYIRVSFVVSTFHSKVSNIHILLLCVCSLLTTSLCDCNHSDFFIVYIIIFVYLPHNLFYVFLRFLSRHSPSLAFYSILVN